MKVLYILYQLFIALPILLVLTILTAIVTIIGSWIGNPHFWGYYPGKIWSQLFCYVLLIPVKVVGHPEVLKKTSYVFVANHQGSFDIFLIYGFLGRNFKWMMKKSLRKMPFVGKACEAAGAPVFLFLILGLFPVSGELRLATSLIVGMPTMTAVVMMANASGLDGDYALGGVFITTISGIITLPAVCWLLQYVL